MSRVVFIYYGYFGVQINNEKRIGSFCKASELGGWRDCISPNEHLKPGRVPKESCSTPGAGLHLVPIRQSAALLELLGTLPEFLDAEHHIEVHRNIHDSDDDFGNGAEYVECRLSVIARDVRFVIGAPRTSEHEHTFVPWCVGDGGLEVS